MMAALDYLAMSQPLTSAQIRGGFRNAVFKPFRVCPIRSSPRLFDSIARL